MPFTTHTQNSSLNSEISFKQLSKASPVELSKKHRFKPLKLSNPSLQMILKPPVHMKENARTPKVDKKGQVKASGTALVFKPVVNV